MKRDTALEALDSMFQANWRNWRLLAIPPILTLAGCQGLFGSQGPPRDPLFLSVRPVEGKSAGAGPLAVAVAEPSLPPVPEEIYNRPSYAQRRATTSPEQVIVSSPRNPNAPDRLPSPPRLAPGVLTNRPGPGDLEASPRQR